MTDNIIQFGKTQQTKSELDYKAIRDSVLGEPNILNIEGSIRHVSTDYLNQDDEFLNKMDLLIRDMLDIVLESDDHCDRLHHTLLGMDNFHNEIVLNSSGKTPYITTSIDFNIDVDNVLTLYILQLGFSRFIRTIRLNNEILHAIPN